jgi:hypothetical protein
MARTTKIIEAPRLNDLVINGVTTQGLVTLVNTYLATLVNPTVRQWALDVRVVEKRMALQWLFSVTTDDSGAALANPFTLSIIQATSAANLALTLNTMYAAILPVQFFAGPRITKLDSDINTIGKQFIAAGLQNALAAAVANYLPVS